MNAVEIEQVREHLRERVRQAKKWYEDGFPSGAFDGFSESIRGRLCSVRPVAFVNHGNRKYSKGIRFRVTWHDAPLDFAEIDVLLAPEAKTNERVGLGPTMKVKAVDPDEGSKVKSDKDIISPWVGLNDCDPDESIEEFFKKWLRRAFANQKKGKILDFAQRSETGESEPH